MDNRITGYMDAGRKDGSDMLFWGDFARSMHNGTVSVKGTVRIEVSKDGEYRLNIDLVPDQE